MVSRSIVILALAFLGIVSVNGQGTPARKPLEGAWRVSEVITTGPNARQMTKPNPGLIMITATQFALVVEAGDTPRPPLLPGGTLEQFRAVLDPFLAFAGPYEASDTLLTLRPTIHKNPANMRPGAFISWSYQLAGNTLTLVTARTHEGPTPNPITWTLTRVD